MSTTDDGGPAFPFAATDGSNIHMQAPGMSLRDYFAGQALQGQLAAWSEEDNVRHARRNDSQRREMFAYNSYAMADAMLAARKVQS